MKRRFCKYCNGLMRLGFIRPDNWPKWIHSIPGAGTRCRKMREKVPPDSTKERQG